jgi:RND family efflux transporter MFP subunit
MRRMNGILPGLLAVLAASCSGTQGPAQDGAAGQAHELSIATVRSAPVQDFYEAVGTVRSHTTSVLSSRIVGSVVAVHVQEGERVERGQLLLEIDDRDAQSHLSKAQAGLREAGQAAEEVERGIAAARSGLEAAGANRELAESTFQRYRTLLERRSVSQQEFEEVQARFRGAVAEETRAREMVDSLLSRRAQVQSRIEQARADVQSAGIHVGYGRILAPIAGVVAARPADVGTQAAPGVPLLTVEDDTRYRFEVAVEESRASQIVPGEAVEVIVDALGGRRVAGKVSEIVPASDPNSRSVTVKIQPDAEGAPEALGRLRSGFFVRARFEAGTRQALSVPQGAIVRQGQLVGLYVVADDSLARLRLIRTGKTHATAVEVLSGLAEGERVVVDGLEGLRDGMRVQVRPEAQGRPS